MPVFLYIIAALCVLFALAALRGSCLKTTDRTVSLPSLPNAFDGFSVVVLSDLHDRAFARGYGFLADRVAALKPDVILFAGDLHNAGCTRTDYADFLDALCAVAPVYLVRGNHEPGEGREEEMAAFESRVRDTGAVWLDEPCVLSRGTQTVTLKGLSYGKSLQKSENNGFEILLTHDPDVFDAPENDADLTVAGHIHGGFVRLPIAGAFFAPGEGRSLIRRFERDCFFPKYAKGLYERDGRVLYVSEGLGMTSFPPVRFIRGEIGRVVLKKN